MAVLDNNPTFTYVSYKNMMIIHNQQIYTIQNGYSNKKYLYWEHSNPYQLTATDVKLAEVGNRFLVIVNDRGIHTLIPHDELTVSFDGENPDLIAEKIFGIYENNKDFGKKFMMIEENIDGIKETIGEEGVEGDSIINRLTTVEKTTSSINLEVKEIGKEYSNDKAVSELREEVNMSIIEMNSALGLFKSYMDGIMNSGGIESSVKTEISLHIDIINNKKAEMFLQVDKVLALMNEGGFTDKYNALKTAKESAETTLENLITIINTSISDNVFVPSEITMIIDAFGRCNTKINALKNSCDDCITLGTGGLVSEELARLDIKSNQIKLSVRNVESAMKNNLSIERGILQSQLDDVFTSMGKFKNIVDTIFEDGGISDAEIVIYNEVVAELDKEIADITAKYNEYYNDSNLKEQDKLKLKTEHDKFIAKYNELKSKINEVMSDKFVNEAEIIQVDTVFLEFESQLNEYHRALVLAIGTIESNKFNAEIQKMKIDLQKEIDDVNKRIDDLDFTIDGTFANNIIDKMERENINQNLETLLREKTDVDNQYKYWYNNVFLDGTLKTQYKTSYDLYTSKYNALVKLMNDILAKTELVNDTDKLNLSNANKELITAIEKFVTDTEKVIDYVSKKAVEKAKSDLHKEIGDVNTSVGDLSDYIDGTFKDNVFDKSEKESIKQNLNNLSREKADVDSQYEKLYSNANLDGTLKIQYKASHDDYVSKYNNLVLVINNIVNKVELINDIDRANLENANALLNGSIKAFIGKSNEVIDYTNKKEVSKAKTELSGEIGDVQGSLKDLNDEMNGAFKDGILDSIEISAIEEQLRLLNKEKLDVDGQFTEVFNNKDLI